MIIALSAGVVLTAGITAFICLKIPAKNKASKTIESSRTVESAKPVESATENNSSKWRKQFLYTG